MSLSLLLDSQVAKLQNPNSISHDFRIRFDPPIELNPKKKLESFFEQTCIPSIFVVQCQGILWQQHTQMEKEN